MRSSPCVALVALAGFLLSAPPAAPFGPPLVFQHAVASPADGNGWAGWSVALAGDTLALGTDLAADDGEAAYLFELGGVVGE